MSNLQVPATLRHWHGPFFPPQVTTLHAAYAEWFVASGGLNPLVLVRAANGLRHFRHPATEATDDGYFWARGLVFKILRPGNVIAGLGIIMFPHCTDGRKQDGTVTDRSIALYASTSVVTIDDLEELVRAYHVLFVAASAEALRNEGSAELQHG